MSPCAKIIKESDYRLRNGNFSLLTGAFTVLCMGVLLAYFIISLASTVAMAFLPDNQPMLQNVVDTFLVLAALMGVFSPLWIGFLQIAFNIAQGKDASLDMLFVCFKQGNFKKSMQIVYAVFWRKCAMILSMVLVLSLFTLLMDAMSSTWLFVISTTFLTIILFCVYIWYSLRFTLVPFIAFQNNFTDKAYILNLSNNIMKTARPAILMIFAKNIHLLLLSFLVLPTLYTVPKLTECIAVSSKWLTHGLVCDTSAYKPTLPQDGFDESQPGTDEHTQHIDHTASENACTTDEQSETLHENTSENTDATADFSYERPEEVQ